MSTPFQVGPVHVTYEERIATVTLRREAKYNALSVDALKALREVALRLREDAHTSVVILTGDPVFSSGADLSDPGHQAVRNAPLLEKRELLRLAPSTCAAWEDLDQVTIVAIEGVCIGGALALAVSCNFRIAGRSAFLSLPEAPLGWNMSWGATPRLVSLLGPAKARRLLLFGERVHAPQALEWGLIDEMAEDGEALAAARRWARKTAELPPIGMRMINRSVTERAAALDRLAAHMDIDQYILSSMTEDNAEAISAFLEKRQPVFRGR